VTTAEAEAKQDAVDAARPPRLEDEKEEGAAAYSNPVPPPTAIAVCEWLMLGAEGSWKEDDAGAVKRRTLRFDMFDAWAAAAESGADTRRVCVPRGLITSPDRMDVFTSRGRMICSVLFCSMACTRRGLTMSLDRMLVFTSRGRMIWPVLFCSMACTRSDTFVGRPLSTFVVVPIGSTFDERPTTDSTFVVGEFDFDET
jgi:hypothetical protein